VTVVGRVSLTDSRIPGRRWLWVIVLVGLGQGCSEVVELDPNDPRLHAPAHSTPVKTAPLEAKPPDARSSETTEVRVVAAEVDLESRTRDGLIQGRPLGPDSRRLVDDFRLTVQSELVRYPTALLQRIGLRGIVLCEFLAFDAVPCAAFADVEHGNIVIDVLANADRPTLRRTLHHELSHQIDYADDRQLDRDPAWEALNPPGFRYSQDAERFLRDPIAGAGQAPRGFLSRYATSSPTEDKAVLFEALVTDRTATRALADADPVLGRKVARIRATLEALGADPAPLIGP
jgi:hypothetical protein